MEEEIPDNPFEDADIENSGEFETEALADFGITGQDEPGNYVLPDSDDDLAERLARLEERVNSFPLPPELPFVFPAAVTGNNFTELVPIGGVLVPGGPRSGSFINLNGSQSIMIEAQSLTEIYRIMVPISVSTSGLLARITGVFSTTNATTWIYSIAFPDGSTSNGYNGLEWSGATPSMIQGSPGSLGITVATNGSVTGTSCFIRPIGETGYIPVAYDIVNARWMFGLTNSAGA